MYTSVEISADDLLDGSAQTLAEGLERVHVSMAGEARCNGDEENGAEWRCTRCGEALVDTQRGFENAEQERDCSASMSGQSHEPERVPLSWANSASIWLDEEHDEIALSVSTADPRGGFGLRVWRDDTGVIHVSASDPENVTAHDPSVAVHYARTFPGISD